MNKQELQIHRRNTTAFIQADPVQLALVRVNELQRTASGGVVKADVAAPIRSQTFRLLPTTDRVADVRLTSGRFAPVAFVLMGEWDADMARDDEFEHDGVWYTIAGPIMPEHTQQPYEKKAAVIRRG